MHPSSHPKTGQQPPLRDENHLPTGQCQYILLQPELMGRRCACLRFSLQRSTPGSVCSCGHLAVYHLAADDETTSAEEEMEALKLKILKLEQMLEEERSGWRNSLSLRLSELEEHVDRCRAEIESEVKTAYRGIEGLWHNIGVLQKRASLVDDRIDAMVDADQATHDDVRILQDRLIQVDDATMVLEDRLDALAALGRQATSCAAGSPKSDLMPTTPLLPELAPFHAKAICESIRDSGQPPLVGKTEEIQNAPTTSQSPIFTKSNGSKAWTVHISLLPSASQSFPFERGTVAYKRCLSRGLQGVVAVTGTDSQSFIDATSQKFFNILQGRQWMPLVSKTCDAENLRGLPMLRQLPDSMIHPQLYDSNFLKENCASPDADNDIPDLYIAMCKDTLSWPEIKALPQFVSGFEACWAHDSILDGSQVKEDSKTLNNFKEECARIEEMASTSLFVPVWPSSNGRLKRAASAVSRASSFASAKREGKRVKLCISEVGQRLNKKGDGQEMCELS